MKELSAIKARWAAATPGPWALANPRPDGRNLVERKGYDLYGGEVSEMIIVDTNPSDAEAIAHAPADIEVLTQAIDAVLGALDTYALPSKRDDPTGETATALEWLETSIRQAFSEVLDPDA